ncbi:MAG: amino acid permease [Acidimicrobiia bacterium]|nr:amino acid permease [Acidimicrobiia bacterium]
MSSDGNTGTGVFSRPASGLIRVAGSSDVFIFNVGLVSIGIAIAFNQLYGPSLYPGSAPWLSTLLAVVGMLFVAATFYAWSITFPRSGGVYVSLSRSVGPGVGFVLSLIETVILMYYAALAASLIVTVGLSSFFGTVGFMGESDTFISWAANTASPAGIFWIGTGFLLLAGVLLTSGTRRYFAVQKVLFGIALAGTVVLVAVLVFGDPDTFLANFTAATGLTGDQVISGAQDLGWASAPFSFSASWAFLIWPLLPLLGAVQSVGIGGEIKSVRKTQLYGMLGAVVATGLVIALVDLLATRVFGYDFQGAIGYNSVVGLVDPSTNAWAFSTEGSIGASPWFTVLIGILADNLLIVIIVMATFVTWIWFWIPAEIAYTTRTMIAWSFDRIGPNRLGDVSKRYGTPTTAIWISTAGAIVFMWFIAFQAIALLTLIEALTIIWGTAMIAAVVFPRMRKALFDVSPASEQKIFGMPLMSVTGAVGAAFLATVLVMLWNDDIAAGPLFSADGVRGEFWLLLSLVVLGVLWYVGVKAYRRRQGIDISLAFKQIPIE